MAQGGRAPLRGAGWAGDKPSSVPPRASRTAGLPPRGDGHPSRTAVSRRLQRPTRAVPDEQPGGACTEALLGLAPGGVYLASRSPGCRWALTPPFHLCRREPRRPCLSVALSLRFPSPGVTRRPALGSSDFPRPGAPAAATCPPPASIVAPAGRRRRRWGAVPPGGASGGQLGPKARRLVFQPGADGGADVHHVGHVTDDLMEQRARWVLVSDSRREEHGSCLPHRDDQGSTSPG